MKLIFSRKGFDSAAGKVPSPILPDGRLFSLPIPSCESPIQYGQIHFDEYNLGDLVSGLTKYKILPTDTVHLDPDLYAPALPREANWRPLFGQAGAAQGHLINQKVRAGDIFLFFGWFQPTQWQDDALCFDKQSSDSHCLFGWLQIDKMILLSQVQPPDWAQYHPHCHRQAAFQHNTLYIATKHLTLPQIGATAYPGAGIFRFYEPHLQLSKDGENRSVWALPRWCYPRDGKFPFTYHRNPKRWHLAPDEVRVQTVGRGQEFVLDMDDYPEAERWFYQKLPK